MVLVSQRQSGRLGSWNSAIKGHVMGRKAHMKKLAALVNAKPEMLAEVLADTLRETVGELQVYKPRTCGRITRGIQRHHKLTRGT